MCMCAANKNQRTPLQRKANANEAISRILAKQARRA